MHCIYLTIFMVWNDLLVGLFSWSGSSEIILTAKLENYWDLEEKSGDIDD